MEYYAISKEEAIKETGSNVKDGLTKSGVKRSVEKKGYNTLSLKKKESFFVRLIDALKEPMMLILLFGFIMTFGANLGKYLKTGSGDFSECFGILGAVILSVSITMIMEGSSKKAFETLNKIYDDIKVKVIREGEIKFLSREEIVVGDIVIVESGDKVIADGRVIESSGLCADESALTGESKTVNKSADVILREGTPLAERKNMLYSGTFITEGNGKMLITEVGTKTEMGKIARELTEEKGDSPLQKKLAVLGKRITLIGAITSVLVFGLSTVRLLITGSFTFDAFRELFISCIVLIVAAVPEGLPTIVALSLALNMIKLSKENALIKKMVAAETTGSVSVICSDKTGTITKNEMTVNKIKDGNLRERISEYIALNVSVNRTAEMVQERGKKKYKGNGTEKALLEFMERSGINAEKIKGENQVKIELPFSSDRKYMITKAKRGESAVYLIKGAPEIILGKCRIEDGERKRIISEMDGYRRNAERVICFAHKSVDDKAEEDGYEFDGYASLIDPVRPEVKKAVEKCISAGIKVKILTGDNIETARAVAKEIGAIKSESEVVNARELEGLSEEEFRKRLKGISVIARSTPIIKLRVVRALKGMGEVVAVTGDGINDAPAIKHADVGIAMGVSGSEISKEAADVVLLDDSFKTVVKAVSFGRSVYRNLQKFILFQLSVNVCALFVITVSAIMGMPSPFNTLQLLWINVIMDGPPALTLGLSGEDEELMKLKPVKSSDGIVNRKMLLKILFNGLFMGTVILAEYFTNFLGAKTSEKKSAVFTLFIMFQLFNAFNCSSVGSISLFKEMKKNKIMGITFALVFILHVIIVEVCYKVFGISPMEIGLWIKCIITAMSVVVIAEIYKAVYRKIKGKRENEVREKGININKNGIKSVNYKI